MSVPRLIDEGGLREKGVTYSRMHRHRLIKAGRFPRPVKGAGKSNAWIEAEIDAYIAGLIAERDNASQAA